MMEKFHTLRRKNGSELFLHILETSTEAVNVLFIQSPIVSVLDMRETYEALGTQGCNVFALDLYGTGRSEGSWKEFSAETMVEDMDTAVEYIRKSWGPEIHCYAGNGIGGILAQYYLSLRRGTFRSFAQYGAALPGDASFLNAPEPLIQIQYKVIKLLARFIPGLRLPYGSSVLKQKFQGKNSEQELEFYKVMLQKYDTMNRVPITLFRCFLGAILERDTALRETTGCPVLLFAPQHDRFFPPHYYQAYFDWLPEPKELYRIDDAHTSYLWHAEELCTAAVKWFRRFSGT